MRCFVFLFVTVLSLTDASGDFVDVLRVPNGGIQPQAEIDDKGVLHLVYFLGDSKGGDLYYVTQVLGDTTFSEPVQVNTVPSSVIAIGTVRGAQMALGRHGRVHVAWMGSVIANGGTHDHLPMFYTHLDSAGTGFVRQRNVIQSAYGLDGGGSVAADTLGNVYVAWHAGHDEASRQVWMVHSKDGGQTFSNEKPVWEKKTGACGCCGMRVFAHPSGTVYVMYRSAQELIHRDMYILQSTDFGQSFEGVKAHEWQANQCPMSTSDMFTNGKETWSTWETQGRVFFSRVDNLGDLEAVGAIEQTRKQKHPALAKNAEGLTTLAWLSGSGWQKGGTLWFQIFDLKNQPHGSPMEVGPSPVWNRPAVVVAPDDHFVLIY